MIDDLDHTFYYPIDYKIENGCLVSDACTYNRDGEEFSLRVNTPISRAGFKVASRILRAWLRGRKVKIENEVFQLTDIDAVFNQPLVV